MGVGSYNPWQKMKNLLPSLSKFDLALFKQQVVEREDEQMCVVRGGFCLFFVLKKAPVCQTEYLFRTTRYWSDALGDKGCTENTWVGVYML